MGPRTGASAPGTSSQTKEFVHALTTCCLTILVKPSLLSASARGATLLIGLQVGSRGLTFLVNQILLRFLTPQLFGISVQLEVYSNTVLFFARESLRVAIQRQADTPDNAVLDKEKRVQDVSVSHVDGKTAAGKTQAIVNLAYVSICLGLVFAVAIAWLYIRALTSGDPSILLIPHFQTSLRLHGIAAILELLAEPCFVVVQQKTKIKIRAAAESVAAVLRCLFTTGLVVWASRTGEDIGVLPFAVGQCMYAVSLLSVYYLNVWGIATASGFSLMLKSIYSSDPSSLVFSYFSRPLLALGSSIFAQSIVKHVLTQGDTILIASLASQEDQGIYALVNNYGGLIARLLLQPIEESSRNYFGKMLSSADSTKPSKDQVTKVQSIVLSLLRAYVLLSICVIAVGPTVAPLLLNLVAGQVWNSSGASKALATYCYYIPLLAVNGLTEAFVSSVATKAEVNRQSLWMLAFSAGFAGASYVFLKILQLGAEGLVWANVLNMLLRIIWSSTFMSGYLKRNGRELGIGILMPSSITIAAGVGTFAVLARLSSSFTGGYADIGTSGIVAVVFLIVVAIGEKSFLIGCYHSLGW